MKLVKIWPLRFSLMSHLRMSGGKDSTLIRSFILTGKMCYFCDSYLTTLCRKLPKFVSRMFPSTVTKLDERAWNAFPYCKTQLTVLKRYQIQILISNIVEQVSWRSFWNNCWKCLFVEWSRQSRKCFESSKWYFEKESRRNTRYCQGSSRRSRFCFGSWPQIVSLPKN